MSFIELNGLLIAGNLLQDKEKSDCICIEDKINFYQVTARL